MVISIILLSDSSQLVDGIKLLVAGIIATIGFYYFYKGYKKRGYKRKGYKYTGENVGKNSFDKVLFVDLGNRSFLGIILGCVFIIMGIIEIIAYFIKE